MKKAKPTVHEKTFKRAKQRANQHLDKFIKMENDVRETVSELEGVITSIDAEMDKLAALRIQVLGQIKGHEEAIKHISNFLGGVR